MERLVFPPIASWGLVGQAIFSILILGVYLGLGIYIPWPLSLMGLIIGVALHRKYSDLRLDCFVGILAAVFMMLISSFVLLSLLYLVLEGEEIDALWSLIGLLFLGLMFSAVQTLLKNVKELL